MKGPARSAKIRRLVEEARRIGFAVEFVEWVASAEYPMAVPPEGMCIQDKGRKLIRVSIRNNSKEKIAKIIEHELEHARGEDRGSDVPAFGLKCGGTYRGAGVTAEESA